MAFDEFCYDCSEAEEIVEVVGLFGLIWWMMLLFWLQFLMLLFYLRSLYENRSIHFHEWLENLDPLCFLLQFLEALHCYYSPRETTHAVTRIEARRNVDGIPDIRLVLLFIVEQGDGEWNVGTSDSRVVTRYAGKAWRLAASNERGRGIQVCLELLVEEIEMCDSFGRRDAAMVG